MLFVAGKDNVYHTGFLNYITILENIIIGMIKNTSTFAD